jgi:hypothetical protein
LNIQLTNILVVCTVHSHLVGKKSSEEQPFRAANGMPVFDWFAAHPETAGEPFNRLMAISSHGQEDAIVQEYDWKQFTGKTIVDVGGSHGNVVGAIKRSFPEIRTICMDLTDVIHSIFGRI